jgi:hypothetical protein
VGQRNNECARRWGGTTSPFIRNFARPLELAAIPHGVGPTYVAVDVPGLASLLFAEGREYEGLAERSFLPEADACLRSGRLECCGVDVVLIFIRRGPPDHLSYSLFYWFIWTHCRWAPIWAPMRATPWGSGLTASDKGPFTIA